jgi:hypothetical protein
MLDIGVTSSVGGIVADVGIVDDSSDDDVVDDIDEVIC